MVVTIVPGVAVRMTGRAYGAVEVVGEEEVGKRGQEEGSIVANEGSNSLFRGSTYLVA